MIRGFNDHAANERTFLAWVRTGLSAIALGLVVKKGWLFAVLIASASSPVNSNATQDDLSCYGGSALLFLQNVMLAARGLDTCPRATFAKNHRLLRPLLRIPSEQMIACGMSIDYADEAALCDRPRMPRMAVDEFTNFVGFSEFREPEGCTACR